MKQVPEKANIAAQEHFRTETLEPLVEKAQQGKIDLLDHNKKLTGRAEAARVFILQRLLLTAMRMRGPVGRLVGASSLWI